jgi:hypothetical protein
MKPKPIESMSDLLMNRRHEVLKEYLLEKVKEADWHGVSDAANDLRVLEAKIERCEKEEYADCAHEKIVSISKDGLDRCYYCNKIPEKKESKYPLQSSYTFKQSELTQPKKHPLEVWAETIDKRIAENLLKEPKPIINPHMKPKRLSYKEAYSILAEFIFKQPYFDHRFAACLRDLGFSEDE